MSSRASCEPSTNCGRDGTPQPHLVTRTVRLGSPGMEIFNLNSDPEDHTEGRDG